MNNGLNNRENPSGKTGQELTRGAAHCFGCGREPGDPQPKDKKSKKVALTVLEPAPRWLIAGAQLCQSCQRIFYRHTSTSVMWLMAPEPPEPPELELIP